MKNKKSSLGEALGFGCGFISLFIALVFILVLITDSPQDDGVAGFLILIVSILIISAILFFRYAVKSKKYFNKILDKETRLKENEKVEENNRQIRIKKADKERLELYLTYVTELEKEINELKKIDVIKISDYKETLHSVETSIIEKGSENKLFEFLKINSFLEDFKTTIENEKSKFIGLIDLPNIKARVLAEYKDYGFPDDKLESIFANSLKLNLFFLNEIKTLEYYKNMSIALIVFYLNDNKIRYFEIREAFEKLGVFDSTWQKNLVSKLDSIEHRLAEMNDQLTLLNENFMILINSTESVVAELKTINSSIMRNNLLQAITAFQVWRINKKTKLKK